MSRRIQRHTATSPRRIRACTIESMPLETDPNILHAVQTVYTTDLGLPEEWTDAQRAEFIAAEADKITWMVRAEAGTLIDRWVEQWTRRHSVAPSPSIRNALSVEARRDAFQSILYAELYEMINCDDED